MTSPIKPTDPAKEPKTKEAQEKGGLQPKDAPLAESYGDAANPEEEAGTLRSVTKDSGAKGSDTREPNASR